MNDRNKIVTGLAQASTSPVREYRFIHTGNLVVSIEGKETKIPVGEVYYGMGIIEMGASMKVGEWLFCLEKSNLIPNSEWMIGGFYNKSHYTFCKADTRGDMNHNFVNYVICTMLPILVPNAFSELKKPEDGGDQVKYMWKLEKAE